MTFTLAMILIGGSLLAIWLFLALYPHWRDWKLRRGQPVEDRRPPL